MKIELERTSKYVLMLLGFAIPISIAATNIILSLALMVLLVAIIKEPARLRRLSRGVTLPLAAYLTVDFIAVFVSGYPSHPAAWFEDKWVLALYLVTLGLAAETTVVTSAIGAMILSGSIMSVYGLVQYSTGLDILRGRVLEPSGNGYLAIGSFTDHLTYGGMALIIAMITASAAIHFPGKHIKRLIIPLTILNLAGLAVSFARSAILGLGAGIMMLIFQIHRNMRRYILLFLVLGVVLTTILVPGLRERFGNVFSSGEHSESPRIRLWLTSVEIIRHHLWFGVGQSNFGAAFDKYHLPGYYVSTAHPHCDLLSIAVDGGVLALGLFTWTMAVFFVKSFRSYRTAGSNAARRMVTGCGIAVAASILLAGLFQNYLSDAEVASAFWFVVGLAMSQSDPEEVTA